MLANLSSSDLLFILISILISMTIHEAMHGYAAYWLGDTTASDMGRLTFNPLKSIDLITTIVLPLVLLAAGVFPIFAAKPVPFNPYNLKYDEYGMAIVGIAGPLTNLVLAIIGAIVFRTYGIHASNLIFRFLVDFVEVNIAFFVFNMIPFPPLDGSRLLYAFAPESLQEVMRRIESAGFLAILFIFVLFLQFFSRPLGALENHILVLLLG